MLYYLPFITLGIFLLLGAVFVYLFMFRGRNAAVANALQAQLDALHAAEANERSTLVWHTVEPKAGQLRAVVIWLDGYEAIDSFRQILTRDIDAYIAQQAGVKWREAWEADAYEVVLSASQHAFEQQLAQLRADGWEAKLGLPFSERDKLVYLAR